MHMHAESHKLRASRRLPKLARVTGSTQAIGGPGTYDWFPLPGNAARPWLRESLLAARAASSEPDHGQMSNCYHRLTTHGHRFISELNLPVEARWDIHKSATLRRLLHLFH